jgi:hypothetical protein
VTADRSATGLPAHVLDRADVRDALARHDFGRVFALAKKWAGISYYKIGEACGIKPERVGAPARGVGTITSHEKIARISDALLIPGSTCRRQDALSSLSMLDGMETAACSAETSSRLPLPVQDSRLVFGWKTEDAESVRISPTS